MTTETVAEVHEQAIVRHYRAQSRADVERAYRTEALQAARAGYVPIAHAWTQGPDGFLLAVTYGNAGEPEASAPAAAGAAATATTTTPAASEPVAAEPEPAAAAEPERAVAIASEPMAAEPEPVAAAPEPAVAAEPEPVAAAPEPAIAAEPEPVAAAPEPAIAAESEPAVAIAPEPVAAQPEPVAAEPEPEPAIPATPQPRYQPVQRIVPLHRMGTGQPSLVSAPIEQTLSAPEMEPVAPHEANGTAATVGADHDAQFVAPEQPSDSFAPPPETAQAHVAAPPESDWLLPEVEPERQLERYTPPPEMYASSPEMYAPVPTGEPLVEHEPIAEPETYAPKEPRVQDEPVAIAEPFAADEPLPVAEPAAQAEPVVASQADEVETAASSESVPAQPAPAEQPATAAEATGRQARLTIQTMDLHTAGEPLRLVRSGFPDVPLLPVLERRQWLKDNADHVRRALIYEPRGHRDMYGAILLPPYNDYADMTVLFMHNEGYSTMCGHGIIAITTGLIEEGLFPASEPVTTIRYEVPAGIVAANAATTKQDDGTWAVRGVRFTNVPSYLAAQSLAVRPDGVELHGTAAQYGALGVDIAFGGAYYGIVNAAEVGLRVVPENADELRRVGAAITEVLRRDHTPAHPSDPDLSFVYGTIIVDLDPRTSPDGRARDAHLRNVTIFAEAELDRSPCGSGTSAILAQLHARGRIKVGQEIVNAGITGEHFLGRIEAETALGPYPAVSTSVAGTAFLTGYSTFTVDSRDPLGDGFLLG